MKLPTTAETVKSELKKLSWCCGISAALIVLGGLYLRGLYGAIQIGIGVAISVVNIYFYVVLVGAIIVKKNIAWMGPVIVIKYGFLIASIYLVWAHCDLLLVTVGLFSELILTAVFVTTAKMLESRKALRQNNGTL